MQAACLYVLTVLICASLFVFSFGRHPEKVQFEWNPAEVINHSYDSVQVGVQCTHTCVRMCVPLNFKFVCMLIHILATIIILVL